MFRGGSTGSGITSGLAPRQGYRGTNSAYDQLVKQIPEIRKQAKEMSYQPRGTNVYDFLTEFGLDIASRPPSGNIISTAAAAAKEPYQRFTQRKGEAEAAGYVSESDMFKTLIGAQADILGGEGAGKGWLEQWKFEQIPVLNEKIERLTKLSPKPGSE